MMSEDWQALCSLLPEDWQAAAASTGALKGLRKDKSASSLLRTLLLHVACGYSLRETVVRARQSGLAELSDVALLKRLRKSSAWLQELCVRLFRERGVQLNDNNGMQFRLFDATHVQEPGQTGSLWRVHYSVRVPSLKCDYFKLTPIEGTGTAESLEQFPIEAGDYIIADRGYSKPTGIHQAAAKGAFVCVRLNTAGVVLLGKNHGPFDLIGHLHELQQSDMVGSWPVLLKEPYGGSALLPCRICAVRKSQEAIRLARKKLLRNASKKGTKLRPETLLFAEYVIVLTTFPEERFTPVQVLDLYRIRWQVELVFKRFKQIAQLGHLPKYDDDSAKAWLYGKLFAALMTERIIAHAESFSPWGYNLSAPKESESVA